MGSAGAGSACGEGEARTGLHPARAQASLYRTIRTIDEEVSRQFEEIYIRTAVAAVLVLALQLLVRHPCRAEETDALEKVAEEFATTTFLRQVSSSS